MSECTQARKLSAYHDGQMSDEDRASFEAHLGQCPLCQAELQRLRRLSAMFDSMSRPELPALSLQRLHRSVDPVAGLGIRRFAEELAAVAAMILVACVIGLANNTSAPASSADPIPPGLGTEAMVQQSAELSSTSSEELLANWVVQDLSGKELHDQN